MAWVGLATQTERMFCASGLGAERQDRPLIDMSENGLMTRGTLMLETRLSPEDRLQTLIDFDSHGIWPSGFMLKAVPNGGVVLIVTQGNEIIHSAVKQPAKGRTNTLRIVYAWDSVAGLGRLSVQHPDSVMAEVALVHNPRPIRVADLRAMILRHASVQLDPDVVFLAVSDRIEPAGPTPNLTGSTEVLTPMGYQRADSLKRGDTVITDEGETVPVLQTVHQTVPARGSFAPVRLRAPYFGLTRDMIVGSEQRIVLDGSDVEYMFGSEGVLAAATHLVNGRAAVIPAPAPTIRYTQLILQQAHAVRMQGACAETLFVGRLRRDERKFKASLLGRMHRNLIPEHGRTAHPVLQPFEAITLAQRRAA
jgi:hypothetical protein